MKSLAYLERESASDTRLLEIEGTRYVVVVDGVYEKRASIGDIVILLENDGSPYPYFKCPNGRCFIAWSKLRRIDENDNEELELAKRPFSRIPQRSSR